MSAPLVVSLVLDDATTARLDAERHALFPPGRTAVGAHLTLFHAVPGGLLPTVLDDVAAQAERPAFDLGVSAVVPLGKGAAYRLQAVELTHVHGALRKAWRPHLTRQDLQSLRPHVTVQNKVDAETARATVARLRAAFTPWVAHAEAIAVWRYVGGPWEPVEQFPFGGGA